MGIIIGVDEVGLGALAGPVVVCAVAFEAKQTVLGLTDSKKLTRNVRKRLVPEIEAVALHWTMAQSSSRQIDKYGIATCKRTCMKWAVRFCLRYVGEARVIVDGIDPIPSVDCECVINGDIKVQAISAASILAKVHRDDLMDKAAEKWPRYWFDTNAGYPTQKHKAALEEHGVCPIHRRSYAPVKKIVNS